MEIAGKLMWLWMAVGFLTGIKTVYIDKTVTIELLQHLYDNAKTSQEQRIILLFTKNRNIIILFTIMGFLVLFLEMQSTYRDAKKGIQKFKSRIKNKK